MVLLAEIPDNTLAPGCDQSVYRLVDRPQVRSLEEAQIHIESLISRVVELERRLRVEEEISDTFILTAWWRQLIFRLDGWSGHRLQDRPQWRPWRRWWTS